MINPWSLVKGFQPVSLCDWPGKVSSVLFLGGCNLICPTCHNKVLVFNFKKLPTISEKHILNYLYTRRRWLDGVVISGGEPTLVDLKSLIQELKEKVNLPVKVDTNGLKPEVIEELLNLDLIDLVAVDIKGPWHKYPELTGNRCEPKTAKEKISRLLNMAKMTPSKFYFRITKVPSLTEEDIVEVMNYLPEGFSLKLQDYTEPTI